jgi:hypothetical protein
MHRNEHAERGSEKTAKLSAEGTSRVKDAAATASDQAIRRGAEMFQRNAETFQHTIQSSAKLASTMAERSADHFGRAFDFAGEGLTERSSRNMEAVVQSGTIMAEMMQRMCVECGHIARGRIERGFERMGALMQFRTPQDIVALQSEIFRDNVETFLGFAQKLGENSTRLAEEAKRRVGSLGEVMTSRPGEVGGQVQTAQGKPAHRAVRTKSAHKRSARIGGVTAQRPRPSRAPSRAR